MLALEMLRQDDHVLRPFIETQSVILPRGWGRGTRTHREHIWLFRDSETTSPGRSQPKIKPPPVPAAFKAKTTGRHLTLGFGRSR